MSQTVNTSGLQTGAVKVIALLNYKYATLMGYCPIATKNNAILED